MELPSTCLFSSGNLLFIRIPIHTHTYIHIHIGTKEITQEVTMKFFKIVSFLVCTAYCVQCALLGIDFGTQNTKAVLIAPGVSLDVLLTPESKRKEVSGLAATFDKDGKIERHFGTHALASCVKSPQSCMLYMNTIIEGEEGEIQRYQEQFPGVAINKDNHGLIRVTVKSRDGSKEETFHIEEVLGMVFNEIKKRAEQHWSESASSGMITKVDDVVISVPYQLSAEGRLRIIDGAEIAGLNVVSLVEDGMSIAIDYLNRKNEIDSADEYHLIFDGGAGQTKLTLTSVNNKDGKPAVNIISRASTKSINGEIFTSKIRDLIIEKFDERQGKGLLLRKDARLMQKLWQIAERTKLILSANTETDVYIESLYDDNDFRCVVTREEFEELLKKERGLLGELVDGIAGNLTLGSIVLSGGSSRIPWIQKLLVEKFGEESISKNVNADESVVFGTIMRGAQLMGLKQRFQFTVNSERTLKYWSEELQVSESITVSGQEEEGTLEIPGLANTTFHDFNVAYEKEYMFEVPESIDCNSTRYVLEYGADLNMYLICDLGEGKERRHVLIRHHRGMNEIAKFSAKEKLRLLDHSDEEKRLLSDMKNKLETLIYELRGVEQNEAKLAELDELLDWLDYESGDATFSDVSKRYEELHGEYRVILEGGPSAALDTEEQDVHDEL